MTKQSGQVLVIVIATLGVVLFTVLAVIAGAQAYYQNAYYSTEAEKATALAEAGIEKAITSLNKQPDSYVGEENPLGDGWYSVSITPIDAATKAIESTGYIPDKTNPKVKRTIKINSSRGIGAAFNYGIQVGEGGLELGNDNILKGSVYSNGSITMGTGNIIEGGAWVAAGIAPTANQQTDCEGSNCMDYLFGRSIDGQDRLDVAMSFTPSIDDKIRKVSLKIKKIGTVHPDLTVRIMSDDNGKPKRNPILATGTLFSSRVTEEYGFIDVTFSSNPTLSAGTIYWIMVDTSADINNYWSWQNDFAQSYNNGQPKWSLNWNTGNPVWNSFSGDLSFKVYMGGTTNSLTSGNNTIIYGDAYANTINGLRINGQAYYQNIDNSIVGGSSCPNPNCHPDSEDPPPQGFPISEANITSWEDEAEAAGTLSQPTCGSVVPWGPGKYSGNLTLGSSCNITVKTPIWITGNLTLGNSDRFTLDSSYGSGSGVIVAGSDGTTGQVEMGNQNQFLGTGVGNSILVLLSTYDSRTNSNDAIKIGNIGNTGVFYADKGIIDPGNENIFKEITAWKIKLTNESIIDYETGLASILFTAGPQGSYSLVRGTYQVK